MSVKHIIISLLTSVFFCLSAAAQTSKVDSVVLENALLQAVQMYSTGDYQRAVAMLEVILEKNPQNDAAHYYLGMSQVALSDLEQAELHLSRAAELDPKNYWYRSRIASIYSATKRTEEAVAEYESMLKDFPKKTDTYYSLAELYPALGKMDEALAVLDKIDTLAGRSDGTAMERFQILCDQKKFQEAYDFLIMVDEEVESPQIKSILGDYYIGMDQDSLGLAKYNESLEIYPNYVPALLGKAEYAKMQKDNAEYFRLLEVVMRDESVTPAGKLEFLKSLIQQSDPRFALANQQSFYGLYDAAYETHPSDNDLALMVVGIRHAFGDYEAEGAEARRFMEIFPDKAEYLEYAVYAAYNTNDYDGVLSLSEIQLAKAKAAGDKDQIVSAYSSMGDMYHQLGNSKKAYKCYDAALKVNPEYAPVLNNYAYYLSEEGKSLKKAYKMSSKSIELESDNATYLDTFGWILHLMGKETEALSIFKRVMIYGGKDSAVILNHYADVLEANGKSDLAEMYRKQAAAKE